MFQRFFYYVVTPIVVFAQVFTIFGNLFRETVHGSTIWKIAPITVLCFGILAVLEAIDKRKSD